MMADVARIAGVSTMTVSRVLSGHPNVSPTTRTRVERAVERLGYRPNTAARALVTGRTATIGVVAVETPHYGPANTLFGIEAAARDAGLFVTVALVRNVDEASIQDAVDHLRSANVDGLAVVAPTRTAAAAVEHLSDGALPLVVLHGVADGAGDDVGIDQDGGARAATAHLLDLGHRTVHHVRGRRGWLEAGARADAWRAVLRERGRVVPDAVPGDWTARSGYEAGLRLAADPGVTAVFAANDQMALGVLRAMQEAGRRVPDDVSVVGFDDIPEAAYLVPPLTTVRQDFTELGRRCVARLRDLLDGLTTEGQDLIPADLVVRASSAPPFGRGLRRGSRRHA